MQTLLPEHLLIIASALDGPSYLALAQTTRQYYQALNKKDFLEAVMKANQFPFLVVDAEYYNYCYRQHFLTGYPVRGDFYKVLKRTIHAGRMTLASLEQLKKHINELMIVHIKSQGSFSIAELENLEPFLSKYYPYLAKEVISFLKLYDQNFQVIKSFGPKPQYLREAKAGNVEWFRNNFFKEVVVECFFRAVRYNQHELLFFLAENYKGLIQASIYTLFDFLYFDVDATTLKILLAIFPLHIDALENLRVSSLIENDNAEALNVFFDYILPRTNNHELQLLVGKWITDILFYDAVGCFKLMINLSGARINQSIRVVFKECVLFLLRDDMFRLRCYRIQRYYL